MKTTTSKPKKNTTPHARMRTQEEIDTMPGRELPEKRTRTGKMFSLGENLYQAVISSAPVHYQDEKTGAWNEIDASLTAVKDDSNTLERKAGKCFGARISAQGQEPTVRLSAKGGEALSWSVEGATANTLRHNRKERKAGAHDARIASLSAEDEMFFADIFPGVDLRCQLDGAMFKDDIIFKSKEAVRPIAFLLEAKKATLTLAEDGHIEAKDSADETVFDLPAPFMQDAVGSIGKVSVSLDAKSKTRWRMVYEPDSAWMESAQYPVTLDPVVIADPAGAGILNNYVSSRYPTTVQNDLTSLIVANNHATLGNTKAYMKFSQGSLPAIDASFYVTSATLSLPIYSISGSTPIYLREVLADWNPTTITYNNKPETADMDLDFAYNAGSKLTYDISNLVRKWYNGDNFGFMLEDRGSCIATLYSASGAVKPTLTINYVSLAGLEDYLAYESHGVGRAGTAHVSLYNGNLIFTHSDTATNGTRMPVSIAHTYNSCYHDHNCWSAGYGWKHSMQLTLHKTQIQTESGLTNHYVLTDGDGTQHFFKAKDGSTTEYEDMSGLSLKMVIDGSDVTIRDKKDGVMTFDLPTVNSEGFDAHVRSVKTVTDALGNRALATYNILGMLATVADGVDRITSFSYNSQGLLSNVKAPGEINGVTFSYDANSRLTTITHEDGKQTLYTYSTDGLLEMAINLDSDGIFWHDGLWFAYGGPTYRIEKVQEFFGGGAAGSWTFLGNVNRRYIYGDCKTTVVDEVGPDGKKLYYHFNTYGNVISVNDMLGYGAFAQYSQAQAINHPQITSKMQRSVINLLKNHNFRGGTTGWAFSGGATVSSLAAEDGSYSHMTLCMDSQRGNSMGYQSGSQTLTLQKGKTYTLSFNVKRTADTDVWAGFGYYQGTLGVLLTVIDGDILNTGYCYRQPRVSYTFTVPADAGSNDVTVFIKSKATSSGSYQAFVYNVQLEEGPIANHYNWLLNGDFSFNTNAVPLNWTANGFAAADKVYTVTDVGKPAGMTDNVLRIYGTPGKSAFVYQDIILYGNAGESVVIGGWAKGYSCPRKGAGTKFTMQVQMCNANNGLYSTVGVMEWGQEWTDWQFACGAVIAPWNFSRVRVIIEYQNNVNYAEFDGLFMHHERFGNTFIYDTKNNLIGVSNLTGYQSDAQYDTFNNLTSFRAPGYPTTVKTLMEYGATDAEKKKHLLKKATSPTGIVQTYTHDTAGNITSATTSATTGTSQFIKSTSTYTANMNYPVSGTNARGKTATTQINTVKGVVNSVTDANGQTATYARDALDRVTSVQTTTGGKTYKNEYAYTNDCLTTVKHNTSSNTVCDVVYKLSYDNFGTPIGVDVGNKTLSYYVYDRYNYGNLPTGLCYGNGAEIQYTRDAFKRIIGVKFDSDTTDRYIFGYDAAGNIARVEDKQLGRISTTETDSCSRLYRMKQTEGNTHLYTGTITYNEKNQVTRVEEEIGANRLETSLSYSYDNEGRILESFYENGYNSYEYDSLGRLANKRSGYSYLTQYGYVSGGQGTNSTTSLVASVTQSGQNVSYTYDNVGNILTETRNGVTCRYTYDGMGQLTRVDDPRQSKTIVYEYDRGGNILSMTEHAYTTGAPGLITTKVNYTYGDSNWKDKLTDYTEVGYFGGNPGLIVLPPNGSGITYDQIGNPLKCGYWNYTWQAGRQLKSVSRTGETITFDYDANGIRTRKTSTSRGTTNYTLRGGKIIRQVRGSVEIRFWYDGQGNPAMASYSGAYYYYVLNAQGDVLALIDATTKAQVVEYAYDAWGKQVSCTGSMASTLGVENPLRYRGYVYDVETGWYYLKSRYYNPVWGRFVNADEILSRNLFAYCVNSPLSFIDTDGFYPEKNPLVNVVNPYGDQDTPMPVDFFISACIQMVEQSWIYPNEGYTSSASYGSVACDGVYRFPLKQWFGNNYFSLNVPTTAPAIHNTLIDLTEIGDLDDLIPGAGVTGLNKAGNIHLGVYVGRAIVDGKQYEHGVIQAPSHGKKVMISEIGTTEFTHSGRFPNVDYGISGQTPAIAAAAVAGVVAGAVVATSVTKPTKKPKSVGQKNPIQHLPM